MALIIQCPHCGKRYKNIPEQYIGKITRCKKCHTRFRAESVPPDELPPELQDLVLTDLHEELFDISQNANLSGKAPASLSSSSQEQLQDILLRIEGKLDRLLTLFSDSLSTEEELLEYTIPSEFGNLDI